MQTQSVFFLFLFFVFSMQTAAQQMTVSTLGDIILDEAQNRTGEHGNWQFIYGQRVLMVLTDSSANRMRIFTPVEEESALEHGQLKKMLEANFHTALDAKYSLYNDYVISVFTHPLKELTKEQFIDAMRQVVVLGDTFGTSYQSTGLIFAPGQEKKEEENEENKKRKKPSKKS